MHNVGIDPGIQIMQQSIHERVPMFTHEGLVHQAVTSFGMDSDSKRRTTEFILKSLHIDLDGYVVGFAKVSTGNSRFTIPAISSAEIYTCRMVAF